MGHRENVNRFISLFQEGKEILQSQLQSLEKYAQKENANTQVIAHKRRQNQELEELIETAFEVIKTQSQFMHQEYLKGRRDADNDLKNEIANLKRIIRTDPNSYGIINSDSWNRRQLKSNPLLTEYSELKKSSNT